MSKVYELPKGWNIGTSPLGCGITILQGWSHGFGISGNDNGGFERRMFDLLYFSKVAKEAPGNLAKYGIQHWGSKSLSGENIAPGIGVGRIKWQFLGVEHLTLISSTADWITKFKEFVKANDLGEFSHTEGYPNIRYHKNPCAVALWVWNGKLPKDEVRKAELDAVVAKATPSVTNTSKINQL